MSRWTWCVEWKAADCWIGVFWKHADSKSRRSSVRKRGRLDIWVCVLPCVPIHIIRRAAAPTGGEG